MASKVRQRARQSRRDANLRKAKARAQHWATYRSWLDRKKKLPTRGLPDMRQARPIYGAIPAFELERAIAIMSGERFRP